MNYAETEEMLDISTVMMVIQSMETDVLPTAHLNLDGIALEVLQQELMAAENYVVMERTLD